MITVGPGEKWFSTQIRAAVRVAGGGARDPFSGVADPGASGAWAKERQRLNQDIKVMYVRPEGIAGIFKGFRDLLKIKL